MIAAAQERSKQKLDHQEGLFVECLRALPDGRASAWLTQTTQIQKPIRFLLFESAESV
jgi:hypothetical protein